jgi:hypothetical protein
VLGYEEAAVTRSIVIEIVEDKFVFIFYQQASLLP